MIGAPLAFWEGWWWLGGAAAVISLLGTMADEQPLVGVAKTWTVIAALIAAAYMWDTLADSEPCPSDRYGNLYC